MSDIPKCEYLMGWDWKRNRQNVGVVPDVDLLSEIFKLNKPIPSSLETTALLAF